MTTYESLWIVPTRLCDNLNEKTLANMFDDERRWVACCEVLSVVRSLVPKAKAEAQYDMKKNVTGCMHNKIMTTSNEPTPSSLL